MASFTNPTKTKASARKTRQVTDPFKPKASFRKTGRGESQTKTRQRLHLGKKRQGEKMLGPASWGRGGVPGWRNASLRRRQGWLPCGNARGSAGARGPRSRLAPPAGESHPRSGRPPCAPPPNGRFEQLSLLTESLCLCFWSALRSPRAAFTPGGGTISVCPRTVSPNRPTACLEALSFLTESLCLGLCFSSDGPRSSAASRAISACP